MTHTADPARRWLKHSSLLVAAVLFSSVLVTACDEIQTSAGDYVARAEEYRDKGDLSASVIEAKNALRIDPEKQDARFILGQNYLDLGDWLFAEVMLEKAFEAKGTLEYAIMPALAEAKLALGKYDEVLKIAQVHDVMTTNLKSKVLVLRGKALHGKKLYDQARKMFGEALEKNPDAHGGYLGLAIAAATDGDWKNARKLLDKASEINPDANEILAFRGQFERAEGDYTESRRAFQKLIKKWPQRIDFIVGLVETEIAGGMYEEAIKTLTPQLKQLPKHPVLNYFRALAAFKMNDYEAALPYANAVINSGSNDIRVRLIAGAAAYSQGQFEAARIHILAVLAQNPDQILARQLLGSMQMKLGDSKAALATLKPLADKEDVDASILELAGKAAFQSKDMEIGAGYLERAVTIAPNRSTAHALLGKTNISLGNVEKGISDLETAVQQNPENQDAETALIYSLLQAKRYAEAVHAAIRFKEHRPGDAVGHVLAGTAYMGLNDVASARSEYEEAFKLEPGRADAGNNLASMAAKNGQLDKASWYLREVLRHHPSHGSTLRSLWALEERRGRIAELETLLEKAVQSNDDAVVARFFYGRLLLSNGKAEKALGVVLPALRLRPNHPWLLEIVGSAYLSLRNYVEAAPVWRQLAELRPEAAEIRFNLARAYIGSGNMDRVKDELESAIKIDDKHLPARLGLARFLNSQGEFGGADRQLEALKKDFPDSIAVTILIGDLMMGRGRPQEAVKAFLQVVESPDVNKHMIAKLSAAQRGAGDNVASYRTLEGWLDKNPDDHLTRFTLATYFAADERLSEARKQFELIIKANPDNWTTYNEVAWMLQQAGKNDVALTYAKQARELAPQSPEVADTLGMILLKTGKSREALILLREAARQLPDRPDVLVHLAQALADNGMKDEAKKLLTEILQTNKDFASKLVAVTLLKKLER